MSVIPVVIEQHAEEAAFLWILRDAAVQAPHYSLKDLADIDERVEAHIDGLRIAEDAGWSFCADALAQEEPGEVFAAAVLAFESGQDQRIKMVLEAAATEPELSRGLISALSWLRFDQVKEHIDQLLRSLTPELRRIVWSGGRSLVYKFLFFIWSGGRSLVYKFLFFIWSGGRSLVISL